MAAVMIGVDPHKASHTAAAIGPAEEPLGDVQVRASAAQAEQLLAWAAGWPERTWAVEGAAGLGNLLAQQLVAAGEVVLDVQPKVAARVRLLASGNTNKNDPNDARSVAVAALRSPARRRVAAEDHTAVLKVWSKRYRDLGRARTQVACRLHAVLADLVPGGFSREITAGQAASMLKRIRPSGPAARARRELAADFIADLRRLDAQIRQTRNKLAATVQASGTTLTGIFGVGPVIAAAVLGTAGDPSRFGDRDRFAAYNGTAPVEVSSGDRKIHRLSLRGNRRLNHAIHMAAVTQIRHKHSPGRAYFDRKIAEGKTGKEALRCLKRQISDAIYARLQADARTAAAAAPGGSPGGQSGNGSGSSAAGSHPRRRLFGQATPGPALTLRPPPAAARAPKLAPPPRQAARPARRVTTT
jgi:transposase